MPAINYGELAARLRAVHSALDDALGDSDVTHVESDEELRDQHPAQWAAMKLAEVISQLEGPGRTVPPHRSSQTRV